MPRRPKLRKFLNTIVFLTVLIVAGLFVMRIYADDLTEIALVPDSEFVAQDPLEANAYQDPAMWFSRPGMGAANDLARWQPAFAEMQGAGAVPGITDGVATPSPAPTPTATRTASPPPSPTPSATGTPIAAGAGDPRTGAAGQEAPRFAVFFVHPTSYFERTGWNATLDDEDSQARARLMVRGLASAFNQASEIWVPRYRQATFGAFLTDSDEATRAIDAAYMDVDQAFAFFLDSIPADMPIVLAGHSQGAFHVTRLLAERVQGTPLADRIAMVYAIGWPISVDHDLPALGFPACASAEQAACIVSWASFAEPAEPGLFFRRYAGTPGLDGAQRGESGVLCINPLTGTMNSSADASRNLGTLVPSEDMSTGELVAGAIPARCDERGLLLIGDPPEMGNQRFPGNNYHLVDIPLFWVNLQQDVVRRVSSWTQSR